MSDPSPLTQALRVQAGACSALDSAFCAALLERAADDVDAGGLTTGLFAPWAGVGARALLTDAVPLRWLGALHDLVLSGDAPALARSYPGHGGSGDPDSAWPRIAAAMSDHQARIADFMVHEPQTNEVRRSAALLPGFMTVAAWTALPIRALELGASAGLNQSWDRYHYSLGAAGEWGDAEATVRLDTDWRGPPPPLSAPIRVSARAACDRKPVDLTDAVARRRLKSYVWADQSERLGRLDAAVALALATGVRVEPSDAVAWTVKEAAPRAGVATVVFHSVFAQYMSAESQAALADLLAGRGALAAVEAPLAWLRMEPSPANLAEMELRLTLWPGGEDRLLGHAHPHGAWVEWRGSGS